MHSPQPTPHQQSPAPIDVDAALTSLCAVVSDGINAAGQALVTRMTHARVAHPEANVRSFLAALAPHVQTETANLLFFARHFILNPSPPTSSPSPPVSATPPPPAVHPSRRPSCNPLPNSNSHQVHALLQSLATANRTLLTLLHLQNKIQLQHHALQNLLQKIPPRLPYSIHQISNLVRTAQADLANSVRLLSTMYIPAPPLPAHSSTLAQSTSAPPSSTTPHLSLSSVVSVATASVPHPTSAATSTLSPTDAAAASATTNADTPSAAAVMPSHEHDPLLVFTPAAADVFKAARRAGVAMDDATSNVCQLLLG